jgi:hypothetical protein
VPVHLVQELEPSFGKFSVNVKLRCFDSYKIKYFHGGKEIKFWSSDVTCLEVCLVISTFRENIPLLF